MPCITNGVKQRSGEAVSSIPSITKGYRESFIFFL